MTPIDEIAVRARPINGHDVTVADDPARKAEERDQASHALTVLASLPAKQQEVLELKLRHHLSYREIAAVTGHSETNVGFLIHTGLKALRARLGAPARPSSSRGGAR